MLTASIEYHQIGESGVGDRTIFDPDYNRHTLGD